MVCNFVDCFYTLGVIDGPQVGSNNGTTLSLHIVTSLGLTHLRLKVVVKFLQELCRVVYLTHPAYLTSKTLMIILD